MMYPAPTPTARDVASSPRRAGRQQSASAGAKQRSFGLLARLEQELVLADMRIVANDAGLALSPGVGLDRLQVLRVVAIAAELQNIFGEQRFFRGLVGVVAAQAVLH